MNDGPQQAAFQATIRNLTGIVHSDDINGGAPNAISFTPMVSYSIAPDSVSDPKIQSVHGTSPGLFNRSSSVESYLSPVESTRKNWVTLVNHMASKILFDGAHVPHVATGVEFGQTDGTGSRFVAYARKEVIIAAGAIQVSELSILCKPLADITSVLQTPVLLQLSGIGDDSLLSQLGIPTLIDLKSVGRNLQEQTQSVLGAHGNGFNVTSSGLTEAIAFPNIYQLFGTNANEAIQKIKSSLSSWAVSQATSAFSADALRTLLEAQADGIINGRSARTPIFLQLQHFLALCHRSSFGVFLE